MDFLTSYPYGCTEQTLSAFLPNLLVTRALTELKLAPTERLSALDRQVSAGLRRLTDMQHDDGGWGWWKSDGNHPFMTAYALWGFDEARRTGAKVDGYRVDNGARRLARMYPTYPRAEPDLKVYMAHVLRRSMPEGDEIVSYGEGEPVRYRHDAAREEVWNARSRMSPFGRAVLLLLLDDAKDPRGGELAQTLIGEAQTRGELSWWAVGRDDLLFDAVDTSVEATAFAVQALVRRDPQNPVLERAVRWLLANRTGGHWGFTKSTAMALYGLLGFMQARGETAQPFAADVFVNGERVGQHAFTAAEMTASDPVRFVAPARSGTNQIRIVKRDGGIVLLVGDGRILRSRRGRGRSGSRELAIARRYSKLAPVTVSQSHRLSRAAVRRHGGARRRAHRAADRGRLARLALPGHRGSAAGGRRGGAGHDRLSARAAAARSGGGGDRASSTATPHRVLPGELRAGPLRVRLSREGDLGGHVPRRAGAGVADVRAECVRVVRAPDVDRIPAGGGLAVMRALASSDRRRILAGRRPCRALYWAFLNTPESTVFMLALSLLLVDRAWPWCWRDRQRRAGSAGPAAGRAVRCDAPLGGVPAFVPVALFVLAVWWAVGPRPRLARRARSGEISAWFIATFNWSDVRPLIARRALCGDWLRIVVAPFAGAGVAGRRARRQVAARISLRVAAARVRRRRDWCWRPSWRPHAVGAAHLRAYWMPARPAADVDRAGDSRSLKVAMIALAGAVGLQPDRSAGHSGHAAA